MSDHLRRERHDLHELLLAQLAAHRAEDARRAGLALVGDQHGRVLVEPDVGAVLAPRLLGRAHDHGPHHLALLDLAGGDGVLDGDDHDVAQPAVAALGAAQDPDHERGARARVVRDLQDRFLLYHGSLARLFRALEDLDHPPALALGQRPGLHDAHRIALFGAVLVVRGHRLGAVDLLAVKAVGEATDHRDRDGLLHLVAHHDAGPDLAAPPPDAFVLSRRMVWIRAMSRRIARS